MLIKEQEIRTQDYKILMCRMKYTEDKGIVFELKNGKRIESISLETLVGIVNNFAQSCAPQLHIVLE